MKVPVAPMSTLAQSTPTMTTEAETTMTIEVHMTTAAITRGRNKKFTITTITMTQVATREQTPTTSMTTPTTMSSHLTNLTRASRLAVEILWSFSWV